MLDRLSKTTTYTYDNVDRVVSVSLPNSVVLNYTYDNAGRVLNVTRSIAGGTAVTIDAKTYNNIGQLASHTNALSNTEYTNYGWNALPSTYTSYRGKQTTLGYDLHGLNTLTTHPMGNTVSTTRNAAGDITVLYDGVRTANFGIDSAGRVQTATYGSDPIITNTYLDGNADTITQNGSVTAYKPVIVGFASSTVNGSIYNWQMKNTAQGFMGTSSLYGTDSTDTSSNVRRMRSAIGVSETNVTPDVVTDQFFDQEGRLTGVTRRSRVSYNLYANISQNNVSYTYYPDGRLNLTTYGNGNTEARTYADIYSGSNDIGDRITVVTTTNGSTITKVMDYNAIGQMVSTTVNDLKRTLYAYDLKGQLLTETKQEKQNNVWVTMLTTTYTFDADGNRLTRTRTGSVTENTSYTYNDANQLKSMVQNGTTTEYDYNDAGQLDKIKRNTQNIQLYWTGMGRMNGFGSTAYSYNALGQLVSVNSLRAKSIFGDSAASQVWRDGDTEQLWGHGLAGRFSPTLTEFTHQGVPGSIEITTDTNRVISGSLEMDAYGDLETATGNLQWGQTPYRYIGGLNCQSEGLAVFSGGTGEGGSYRLIMMGERWYDPQVGRFISRDPVFSENLYAYCGNDPVNAVDPEGRLTVGIGVNGGGLVGILLDGGGYAFGAMISIGTYKNGDFGIGFTTSGTDFFTGTVSGGGIYCGVGFDVNTGFLTDGDSLAKTVVIIAETVAGTGGIDADYNVSVPTTGGPAFGLAVGVGDTYSTTRSFNLSKAYRDTVEALKSIPSMIRRIESGLSESIKDLYLSGKYRYGL